MKKLLQLTSLLFIMIPTVFYGQQIENPGFEFWETASPVVDEPIDWSTIKTADDEFIASVAPVTFERSNDAHSGNYSLKLYNVFTFGIVATGAICNGRFHAEFNINNSYSFTDSTDARWHTPFTGRPDSLAGWFKYFPQGNDRAQFKAILHVAECKLPENGTLPNWVGQAYFKTTPGVTYDTWTRFSVPFEYFDNRTPAYMLCVINSGDSTVAVTGSYLFADDLELIYGSSGINDHTTSGSFLIVQKDYLIISLKSENEYLNNRFFLADMNGREVTSVQLQDRQVAIPANLKKGIYVAVLLGRSGTYTQKVLIR